MKSGAKITYFCSAILPLNTFMQMKISLHIVCFCFFFGLVEVPGAYSQAEFNVKAGVESWSVKDEMDADGDSHHSGQTIGFDMHLLHNRFVFAPGFHYHRISVLDQQDGLTFRFGDDNHINYFSIPVTVGFKALDLKIVDVTGMAGGEVFFFYNIESNDLGLDDDQLHGVYAALTGVLHASVFKFVTAEFKYRYALHPMIKDRPESKLRGWAVEVGVKF
jgi:hypothetical protein